MISSPFRFDQPWEPPFELVPVPSDGEARVPDDLVDRIAVYTPHDGGAIPDRFYFHPDGRPRIDPDVLQARYTKMRDWGANLVAEHLAATLGLRHYGRCRIARVLLDFNRFPGSTPANNEDPLESLAIGRIYAKVLDHDGKTALLESCYDPISEGIEDMLADSLIGIAIHTYDETHASNTKRADLSLISLPLSYQRESRLTYGVLRSDVPGPPRGVDVQPHPPRPREPQPRAHGLPG